MAKNTSPRKVELPYKCPKTGLRFADEEAGGRCVGCGCECR